jgi:HPr kinase/phosphorylase
LKAVTVQDVVTRFSLVILAGSLHLDRLITKSRAYRPGLEFVGYFEFFSHSNVHVLKKRN